MRPFDLFFQLNEDRRTDQLTYLRVEMQFYISMMFLGLPDDIHEEKPLFLQFKKNELRTHRRTDRPSYRDARTHLKTCLFLGNKGSFNKDDADGAITDR